MSVFILTEVGEGVKQSNAQAACLSLLFNVEYGSIFIAG
jgi:hypothetical protein